MRCATVEWFEQGETKGKEVDMAAIESLNPDILILKPGERYNMHERTLTSQTEFNKLQRVSFSSACLLYFLSMVPLFQVRIYKGSAIQLYSKVICFDLFVSSMFRYYKNISCILECIHTSLIERISNNKSTWEDYQICGFLLK